MSAAASPILFHERLARSSDLAGGARGGSGRTDRTSCVLARPLRRSCLLPLCQQRPPSWQFRWPPLCGALRSVSARCGRPAGAGSDVRQRAAVGASDATPLRPRAYFA